jgi:hypothetical protein
LKNQGTTIDLVELAIVSGILQDSAFQIEGTERAFQLLLVAVQSLSWPKNGEQSLTINLLSRPDEVFGRGFLAKKSYKSFAKYSLTASAGDENLWQLKSSDSEVQMRVGKALYEQFIDALEFRNSKGGDCLFEPEINNLVLKNNEGQREWRRKNSIFFF